jgi:hypothetical protein
MPIVLPILPEPSPGETGAYFVIARHQALPGRADASGGAGGVHVRLVDLDVLQHVQRANGKLSTEVATDAKGQREIGASPCGAPRQSAVTDPQGALASARSNMRLLSNRMELTSLSIWPTGLEAVFDRGLESLLAWAVPTPSPKRSESRRKSSAERARSH